MIVGFVTISCLFFTISNIFVKKWRVYVPIFASAALTSFILIPTPLVFILMICFFAAFLLNFFMVNIQLNSYVNFNAAKIFSPPVRNLARIIILIIALGYFLNTFSQIKDKGFEIPDSLIDTAIKFVPQTSQLDKEVDLEQLGISQQDLQNLQDDPQLLEQLGINPQLLKSLDQPAQTDQSLFRQIIKDQFQKAIAPYSNYMPFILAVLLFFTLDWLLSILGMLIGPILWLIFYILQKTGSITIAKSTIEVEQLLI